MAILAVLVGIATVVIGETVWPYLSTNHDEGVYLAQAELFRAGQLEMQAGSLADAIRPWFFVEDGGRLYPKYGPYPAILYAIVGEVVGIYRVALGLAAALNVALVYGIGSIAFDRRVGALAAVLFAVAPMTLLTSSAFLPYAPTATLLFGFVWLYLRGQAHPSIRAGVLVGIPLGVAMLGRPYTALLVGVPFIGHAGWQVLTHWRAENGTAPFVRHHVATLAVGLGFVALTLAYNARLTGDPLVFPYEAFAPRDGPGFGTRAILNHELEYTIGVAINATTAALYHLLTRWGPLGFLGTIAAFLGFVAWRQTDGGTRRQALVRWLLVAMGVSVIGGNIAFWGVYNQLGTPFDPTDGLVSLFGPFYHFTVLLPLAVFGAAGLWWSVPRIVAWGTWLPVPRIRHRQLLLVGFVVVALLTTSWLLVGPLDRHEDFTDRYDSVYDSLEESNLSNALVLVPDPYGPWLHHPFQTLRNDPNLDGSIVYGLDENPGIRFELVDAYPERSVSRLTYRGDWAAPQPNPVIPRLTELSLRSASGFAGETTVGVPERVSHAYVRLQVAGQTSSYRVASPENDITVNWTLTDEGAQLARFNESMSLVANPTTVRLSIRLVTPDGATLTYGQEVSVRTTGDEVEVLWPPIRRVCPLVDRCGRSGTYLPNRPEEHLEGVAFDVAIEPSTTAAAGYRPIRSSSPTRTIDARMAPPPRMGSSVVSPTRSRYSIGSS